MASDELNTADGRYLATKSIEELRTMRRIALKNNYRLALGSIDAAITNKHSAVKGALALASERKEYDLIPGPTCGSFLLVEKRR